MSIDPRTLLRTLLVASTVLASPAMAQTAGAPTKVTNTGYLTLGPSEVPVKLRLTGRAVALSETQIRPRVSGTITAISYAPGSFVKAGAPLFEIDSLTYEIAVAVAEANLARTRADLVTAEQAFERAERLQGSATSRSAFEVAEAALLKARASVGENEANLRLAKAQLEWTVVRAPISGTVGVADVAIGDLVTQNQSDALTTIVQSDPLYVDLTEPYPTRQRIEAAAERGEINLSAPDLTLILDGGRQIEGKAKLMSTSATVSTTTGTRRLRFEVANPNGLLAPGMFLHGELQLGSTSAILVPQRAAIRERDGRLSAWVESEGKSAKRYLVDRGTHGTNWVVIDGVSEGDKLLVDGINNMREGQDIALVPVQIDAMGVVRDVTPGSVGN